MKKLFALLFATLLVFSLVACGSNDSNHSTPNAIDPDPEPPSIQYDLTSLNEPLVIDTDKMVKIVLQDLKASFEGSAIQIKNANSVQIYVKGTNELESTGTPTDDNEIVTIASDIDLIFFGDGSLTIKSTGSCIKTSGSMVIMNGTYDLTAADKAMHANETMVINTGNITAEAEECLEATQITVNGGTLNLKATDDAINASDKSANGLEPKFTMAGGTVIIEMAEGDTDGIDSNGDLIIHGGVINITAQSAFDWDGELVFDGGTVIINGEEVTEITNQFEGQDPNEKPDGEKPNDEGIDGKPNDGKEPPNGTKPTNDGQNPPELPVDENGKPIEDNKEPGTKPTEPTDESGTQSESNTSEVESSGSN